MAQPGRVTYPRRGEIYLVSFDPAVGSEMQKTRPALILQNDIANRHSPITIVAALTSQFEEPLYLTEVLITPYSQKTHAASRWNAPYASRRLGEGSRVNPTIKPCSRFLTVREIRYLLLVQSGRIVSFGDRLSHVGLDITTL